MDRLPVSFSKPQLEWLRAEAQRLGISIAEVLRRIVDEKRGA